MGREIEHIVDTIWQDKSIRENGECDQRYCTECGTVHQWSDKLGCWQTVGTL